MSSQPAQTKTSGTMIPNKSFLKEEYPFSQYFITVTKKAGNTNP
jgi:hypothetical protein